MNGYTGTLACSLVYITKYIIYVGILDSSGGFCTMKLLFFISGGQVLDHKAYRRALGCLTIEINDC